MRRGARSAGGHEPRWEEFQAFLDDMGEPPEGYRLSRKDKALPYSKENCEWRPPVLVNSQTDRDSRNAYMRAYLAKRPEKLRAAHRKKHYGIVDDWYERTLAAQGNVCAICLGPETQRHAKTGEIIALAVDHDNDTGKRRGILCKSCNVSIGSMKHSIAILYSAIAYLGSHASP